MIIIYSFFGLLLTFVAWEILKSNKRKNNQKSRKIKIDLFFKEHSDLKFDKIIEGTLSYFLVAFDFTNSKLIYINENSSKIINFDDIISFEVIENDSVTYQKSISKVIGGAIVGGALAGGVGAVIGGLSSADKKISKTHSIYLKFSLRNLLEPTFIISCLELNSMPDAIGKNSEPSFEALMRAERASLDIKDILIVIIDQNNQKKNI